jgi:hypothetical protein
MHISCGAIRHPHFTDALVAVMITPPEYDTEVSGTTTATEIDSSTP